MSLFPPIPRGGVGDMLAAIYDPAGINAQVAGRTVANIFSVNGAASVPAMTLNGTVFTGGSSTTTKPFFLLEPAGTTSTNWSTGGTVFGINAANGFNGNLLNIQKNNVHVLKVFNNGADSYMQFFKQNGDCIFSLNHFDSGVGNGLSLSSVQAIGFSSTTPDASGIDTFFTRFAANKFGVSTAANADAAVVSTHTVRMAFNGVEMKVLCATP